jgi:hypothetical protein
MSSDIDWPSVQKKEARGLNGEDLGKVQQVSDTFVTIERGLIEKTFFSIPKGLVKDYDGHTLRFRITEEEARNRFQDDKLTSAGESSFSDTQ